MELFIRVKDGAAFEHPILGDNFREAFPSVDISALPPEFCRFVRIDPPVVGVYEIYEGVTYERDGDVFTDVHHVRAMTDEEKKAKQNATRSAWAQGLNFASWEFDEELCAYKSPVPYPTDDKHYRWDEQTTNWVVIEEQ